MTAYECFKAQTEQAGKALPKFFAPVFTTKWMQFWPMAYSSLTVVSLLMSQKIKKPLTKYLSKSIWTKRTFQFMKTAAESM